jgi:TonB-linked SusC/RagA family outer membrane protein
MKKFFLRIFNDYLTKLLRKMKLTCLFFILFISGAFATNAVSQMVKVTLSMKNVTVAEVINTIESQTDYLFVYNKDEVDVNRQVSISVENKSVAEILNSIFRNTNVVYAMEGNNIMLMVSELKSEQQQRTLLGKVTDTKGSPLPGVTVVIKGTTQGTITDPDGKFAVTNIPGNAILQFSFVGMKSQEILVSGKTDINVVMVEDAIGIEEVVAIGYGTIKKSDLTGSVSSIKSKDILERPATNLVEKIQGKAAGVDITQSSGQPGDIPMIRIRGRRSLSASNEPLYVVDGIPFQQGSINDLNPNDIESIEILKDAASSAIYGSRGANGVILVTTKRGTDTNHISYNAYYGVTQISRMPDMMNGEEFAEMKRESYRASNSYTDDEHIFEANELENLRNGIWYNYPDLVFNNGYKTDHQINFSGGNKKTKFALSGGYLDEQGTIKNMYYKRYNLHLNIDQQMNKWLSIGTSTALSRSIQDVGSSNIIKQALLNSPLGECFDQKTGKPNFYPTADGKLANPLFDAESENCSNERKINRIFSSIYSEISFLKNFKYKLNFGFDNYDYRRGEFHGSYTTDRLGGDALVSATNSEEFNYTLENILNYKQQIEKQQFDLTLMQSIQSYSNEGYSSSVIGIPYESQKWYNMDSGITINSIESQLTEWSLASFMGRLNYVYNDKYLIQATLRADGSSRLSESNKWSYFPSAALGWRIINEPWMKNIHWISSLKLRTSYGITGNTAINAYQTQGALVQTVYAWGETLAQGYGLSNIPNPGLRWEKTTTIDGGLDFGVFSGRFSGSIDFYRASTTRLLMERQLPSTSGYTDILENVGSTRNTGLEINLNGVVFDNNKGFNWTVDLNWFSNKEEIVELYGGKNDDKGNKWFIGHPVAVFYDYEKTGIWQTDESVTAAGYGYVPGDIKVKDQNDDKAINADDRIILGSDVPKWSMGITSRMEFKGVDFSFFINTRQGSTIQSNFHSTYNQLFGRYNNLDVDYWTPTNPTNAYPRPNSTNANGTVLGSSMTYFDGSFVKIRNITLGYTLPSKLLNALKISSLRIYITADQPFMFTKYEGFDPERNDGIISSYVPSNKSIMFGINLNL